MAPTLNPVDVLIFDSASADVAKSKIEYYLVSFVAYFAITYLLLYVFKRSNYGRKTVEMLHFSSFCSEYYKKYARNVTPTESEEKITDINNIFNSNKVLAGMLEEEQEEQQAVARISAVKDVAAVSEMDDATLVYTSCKAYVCYAEQRRYLLGCTPILYPTGYKLDLYFIKLELAPGYVENVVLHLCNNHQFFNMMYYIDNKKRFGTRGRILVYVVRESVVFVLSQFISTLAQYYSIDYFVYISPVVKVFIIIPFATLIGMVLLYMYTAPCAETCSNMNMNKLLKSFIISLSRFFIVQFLILTAGALVVACLFTTGNRVPFMLLNFFFTVQVISIVLPMMRVFLGYYDRYYTRLSLMGIMMYSIGDIMIEKLVAEKSVLNVDYFCNQRSYLGGMIKLTTILSREDAMKNGWLIRCQNDSTDDNKRCTLVELKTVIDIAECNNDRFDDAVRNPISRY